RGLSQTLRSLRPAFVPAGAKASNEFGGLTLHAGEVDLLAVRDDEVEHLHRRLVDVVLEGLGLAVENGVPDEADDGDDEPERRAVHRFGDSLCEDARLLARVDGLAADGAEALD